MISSSSSAYFPRTVDLESSHAYASPSPLSSGHFDSLQNQPTKKITYNAHHYWKMPSASSVLSNNNGANDDTWGIWLGYFFCILFFFLIIFVLWYPADYYYSGSYHHDKNMNGVPDHRELRAYHTYPYSYWW